MAKCVLMNMCMILDCSTDSVLIQNKIHSKWSGITFPGGHVEDNESIYESTVREIYEETGLHISDLQQAGLIHMNSPVNSERRIIFLYKTSHFSGELIQNSPEGTVQWVKLTDMENMPLAPNMKEYLNVFLSDNISEVYITQNDKGETVFSFMK